MWRTMWSDKTLYFCSYYSIKLSTMQDIISTIFLKHSPAARAPGERFRLTSITRCYSFSAEFGSFPMHFILQPGSRSCAAGDKFKEYLAVFREFRSLGTRSARRALDNRAPRPNIGIRVLAWSLGVCENRGPRAVLRTTRALGPRCIGPVPWFGTHETV